MPWNSGPSKFSTSMRSISDSGNLTVGIHEHGRQLRSPWSCTKMSPAANFRGESNRVRNQPINTLSHECPPAWMHQRRAWTCCAIERTDAQRQIRDGGRVTGKQGRCCADGIRTTLVHARCCHYSKWQHHAAAQESKQQQHDSDPHRHDFPSLRSLPLRFC